MIFRKIANKLFPPSAHPKFADVSSVFEEPLESYAKLFPEVPLPDPEHSPSMLAARWVSHDLWVEDLPRVAADLLELGYDTPSLRRLAGELALSSSFEAEPLVALVFKELGVQHPLPQIESKLTISRQIAREVIAGKRNPWASGGYLERVIWRTWVAPGPLPQIFYLTEQLHYEPMYRRDISELKAELIEKYAELASLTDGAVKATITP
jgi:hypothetical protein